jgi:GDP-L-fucose synthase
MKIVVTGGSGLLGTYLQKEMDAVYLNSSQYDLTFEEDVNEMFRDHNPDVVVHLAAKAGGMYDNMKRPLFFLEENVMMNTLMLKYAREYGVKKFIGTLSTCIYPDIVDHYPLVETDLHNGLPHVNNIAYGYAKRLMGVHIDISKKQGLDYSYVIPSNLYGVYESGDITNKHFLGALLDKIKTANETDSDHITVLGTGSPLRQFTFAKDVAKVIKLIVENNVSDNMNIGTPQNLSIKQMTEMALIATDSTHLRIEWDTTKEDGQYRKDVDCTVLNKNFPDFQFTDFIDGVREVYKELKK